MPKNRHKKLIVASALLAGATVGASVLVPSSFVSATTNDTSDQSTSPSVDALPEDSAPDSLHDDTSRPPRPGSDGTNSDSVSNDTSRPDRNHPKRPGKPAHLTDEEWEEKKAEIKAKLEAMSDEERREWFESHKPKDLPAHSKTSDKKPGASSGENPDSAPAPTES